MGAMLVPVVLLCRTGDCACSNWLSCEVDEIGAAPSEIGLSETRCNSARQRVLLLEY
jgi:hypothetical protein